MKDGTTLPVFRQSAAADLDAPSVAKLLVEIGQRLVLAGENPYKARSYARAAESLLLFSRCL